MAVTEKVKRPRSSSRQRGSSYFSVWTVVLGALVAAGAAYLLYVPAGFPQERLIDPKAGDGGAAVALTPKEQSRVDELMKQEGFNVVASDKIPYVRQLKDIRHHLCHGRQFPIDQLPAASIIINFHNEVWSALLRTVHSVLARSPERLVHEILLIDDASTKPELGAQLERYLAQRLPEKVRLLRLPQRVGLIKGRHWGGQQATGAVLVFLDSHVEPLEQWLEPLLERIKAQPKTLVCPMIDTIGANSMQYHAAEKAVGGFLWSGHFKWLPAGGGDGVVPKNEAEPFRSPVMSGGLFAMDREFFWQLGGYDTGMDVYGGENLELSFRVWQCGGAVETVPCSRVGHIFRDFHPYSFPWSDNPLAVNMARTAAVWMDEYARYFHLHYRHLEKQPEPGDVSERQALRERLQCRSFSWYLDTVYPHKQRLDERVLASGQLRSRSLSHLCIDTLVMQGTVYLGMNRCTDPVVSGQYMTYSEARELRREEQCTTVGPAESGTAKWAPLRYCRFNSTSPKLKWTYDEQTGQLRHDQSGLCVDADGVEAMQVINMEPCDAAADSQSFDFVKGEL